MGLCSRKKCIEGEVRLLYILIYFYSIQRHWSRDSVTGAVNRLLTVQSRSNGSITATGTRFVFSLKCPQRLWCPRSFRCNGNRRLYKSGVRRTKTDANHSPPSSAEFKNNWRCAYILPYTFMEGKGTISLYLMTVSNSYYTALDEKVLTNNEPERMWN
jgi:hypothetical protein